MSKSWRLNERHYGALQGLDKAETAAKYGEEQVLVWRRSYDVPPPALSLDDPRLPSLDPRYHSLPASSVPRCESLRDTVARAVPYWEDVLAPALRRGEKVLVAAHGNSLRALVKHLDGLTEQEVLQLNIPTAVPLVYELDADLKPVKHYYLGDPEEIAAAIAAVAGQGKAKK